MSTKNSATNPTSFSEAMKELEVLNQWFQQDDIDLEEGLEKLQRAQVLIQYCQKRLTNVENEFTQLRQGFEAEVSDSDSDVL